MFNTYLEALVCWSCLNLANLFLIPQKAFQYELMMMITCLKINDVNADVVASSQCLTADFVVYAKNFKIFNSNCCYFENFFWIMMKSLDFVLFCLLLNISLNEHHYFLFALCVISIICRKIEIDFFINNFFCFYFFIKILFLIFLALSFLLFYLIRQVNLYTVFLICLNTSFVIGVF